MARSYRKTPKRGWTCAKSDKFFKTHANRTLRHTIKCKLTGHRNHVTDRGDQYLWEDFIVPQLREVSEIWTSNKDGKHYHTPNDIVSMERCWGKIRARLIIFGK